MQNCTYFLHNDFIFVDPNAAFRQKNQSKWLGLGAREWIKNRNKLDQNGLGERIAQKQKHKEWEEERTVQSHT